MVPTGILGLCTIHYAENPSALAEKVTHLFGGIISGASTDGSTILSRLPWNSDMIIFPIGKHGRHQPTQIAIKFPDRRSIDGFVDKAMSEHKIGVTVSPNNDTVIIQVSDDLDKIVFYLIVWNSD